MTLCLRSPMTRQRAKNRSCPTISLKRACRRSKIPTQQPLFHTDITGAAALPEGVEMVMPGDNVKMVVTLINPVAMDEGLRFAIREGGRTVGAGVVSKIIE